MSDHEWSPEPESPGWWRILDSPEVDHVEIVDDVLRVRLQSGVELEWPIDIVGDPEFEGGDR